MHWSAAMIAPRDIFTSAPLLRRDIVLDHALDQVSEAVVHASSLGTFELLLDGELVGDDVLSPGWSAYESRLRYRTYDITAKLSRRFVLGARLGNGWFRGRLGWTDDRALYGDRRALIAQLEIRYKDGSTQTVVTDDGWSAGPSEILADDLYDGQTIDARLRDEAWATYGSEPNGWGPVDIVAYDTRRLEPYIGPPVRRQQTLEPVKTWTSPAGRTLVDFGQNIVGWVRVTVTGPPGRQVVVRHAEVLENGELGTRPLRSAQATDRYLLSGGPDVFEPTFTFHGFRYIEIEGWPGRLDPAALEAVVVHSDLNRTGWFACSDPLLNQLHDNVVWGMRGNFLDVPTDCPQRDERMGWTGDLAVFAPAAAFLFDVDDFLRDWLRDLAVEQQAADGRVPYVVPDILKYLPDANDFATESTAIWGDAAVWVPWALWQSYGDLRILHEQYTSMAAHVRRVESLLSPSGLWDAGFQFGDWLDPLAPVADPFRARADPGVIATACAFRTARIMAEAASLTGHHEDAGTFTALAERLRRAFTAHYVAADGVIHSDAQAVYTVAIVFGLLDDRLTASAGDRLAQLVEENGFHIGTGFAGTAYITEALATTGYLDTAYRLLLQQESPSWLYPVTMGATTVWERWDSMLPDGSINPGGMTSFNHYALGAVADWMHRTVGGIAPLEPGYRRIHIAPRPGGGLTWAHTTLETPHGRVEVRWDLQETTLRVRATLPPGVSGVVDLPGAPLAEIDAGTLRVDVTVPAETRDPAATSVPNMHEGAKP